MTQSVEGVDFATIKEAVDYLKANGYERLMSPWWRLPATDETVVVRNNGKRFAITKDDPKQYSKFPLTTIPLANQQS